MKTFCNALLVWMSLVCGGCDQAQNTWQNLHPKDSSLLGIRIQQSPDCVGEERRFKGKHPAMILYVFQDGRVHQTGFEPDGKMRESFWFNISCGDWLWESIIDSH